MTFYQIIYRHVIFEPCSTQARILLAINDEKFESLLMPKHAFFRADGGRELSTPIQPMAAA
jgi:hypothetical protein